MVEIRECNKHGNTPHVSSKRNNNIRWRCRKCAVESVVKRRRIVKEKAIIYKGGKCCICGYNKYNGALDFHHIDPNEKSFTIGSYGHCRAWKKVQKELDKCILLCSNCHKELHGGLITVDMSHQKTIIIKEIIKKIKCIDCGKIIDYKATRCVKCSLIIKRKVKNRPTKENLLKELKTTTFVALGKKYNVSDNAIRKWIK